MCKIVIIFGTRPEAIKVIPVYHALRSNNMNVILCSSGQHSELLEQVYTSFNIKPDIDFGLMKESSNIQIFSYKLIKKLDNFLENCQPSLVLVHGDTTTSFIAAYTSFLKSIPVGHIEAGLRTFNTYSPFPEEANRQATRIFSKLHFAPTEDSYNNLLTENVNKKDILLTGNTVVDSVQIIKNKLQKYSSINTYVQRSLKFDKIVLVTSHRRENQGDQLINIIQSINQLSKEFRSVCFLWPTHPSPTVRKVILQNIDENQNIIISEALDYLDFSYMLSKCYFIISDSGGLQEEAPSYNKPILILRDTTERPEILNTGSGKLIGTDKHSIITNVRQILNDVHTYNTMINNKNPYGDGKAGVRISNKIIEFLND